MFKNLSTAGLGVSGRQSEIIELALSYGFKGVDLDLAEFQENAKLQGLAHARRLLDSARLKIGTFRLPLIWDESDETYRAGLDSLPDLLKLATDLGATTAVTSLAPANDSRPYHENFEFHRRRLGELGEALAPHKIRLGVGFVASAAARKNRAYQFIHSLDALVTLIGMVRAANVGAVVDAWQIHAAAGSLDDLRKLGKGRIAAVYLSDAPADIAPANLTESQRLLLGETGVIDSAAILALLAELDFDGPVTPLMHSSQSQGLRREQLVKLAGARLADAWKAAHLTSTGKVGQAAS
jgi:sugar phosphate isomerase/epimerase